MADIDGILGAMTLEEKVLMLSGETAWIIPGCERLGVSAWTVSDGPIGVRGRGRTPALCLPSSTAWAATFDRELVAEMGAAIAQEARDRAIQVVLGPTVNIHRDPRGGRHFECYSEDPYLTSEIAVAYVSAVQGQGIGACIKHYVANDHETDRHSVSCEVGERALREVYLAPFEAAVKRADAWSVMGSYNGVNGIAACEHGELIDGILRGEFGFKGFVISDWYALRSTAAPANAGLDIEMPGPGIHWGGDKLLTAVRTGEVPEPVIDAKVRRILEFLDWCGGIGKVLEQQEASVDRPEHRELAKRAAARGMVLLKNDGILPLDPARLKRVAILGPNAKDTVLLGGGSSTVFAHHTTDALESIRSVLGEVVIDHVQPPSMVRRVRDFSPDLLGPEGVEVEVYDGPRIEGEPVIRTNVGRPFLNWNRETWPVDGRDVAVRARATFTPDESGRWRFGIAGLGEMRLSVDGERVADSAAGYVNSNMEQRLAFGWLNLEAGKAYAIEAQYEAERHHLHQAVVRFGAVPDPEDDWVARSVEAASRADVAIVVTGTNTEVESEGADRVDINLPGGQDDFVRAVIAANPRTVVVNNSGSPVLMPWAGDAAAILQAWYPGQEGGDAIAEVLTGVLEPGGRMPTTWPKRLEDVPAYHTFPGEAGRAEYSEGVFVGYRWYDRKAIEPRWAFGHGLSYTAFVYGEPRLPAGEIRDDEAFTLTVEVPIRNMGPRAGSEVVQCYVAPSGSRLLRPEQELKGFARVDLAPGESGTATITLDWRSFAAWDPEHGGWTLDGRAFEIRIGASSRDIRARVTLPVAP